MKTQKTSLLLALCAGLALTLTACLLESSGPEAYHVDIAARWSSGDSVLIYLVQDRPLADKKTFGPPSFRIFQVRVDSARKFFDNQLLYQKDSAWACSDLTLDDSLLFLSYDSFTSASSDSICSHDFHGGKIFASIRGIPVSPFADTMGVRERLRDADHGYSELDDGIHRSGGNMTPFTLCVDGGQCLDHQIKVWDSNHPGE